MTNKLYEAASDFLDYIDTNLLCDDQNEQRLKLIAALKHTPEAIKGEEDIKDFGTETIEEAMRILIDHAKECESKYGISGDAVIEMAEIVLKRWQSSKFLTEEQLKEYSYVQGLHDALAMQDEEIERLKSGQPKANGLTEAQKLTLSQIANKVEGIGEPDLAEWLRNFVKSIQIQANGVSGGVWDEKKIEQAAKDYVFNIYDVVNGEEIPVYKNKHEGDLAVRAVMAIFKQMKDESLQPNGVWPSEEEIGMAYVKWYNENKPDDRAPSYLEVFHGGINYIKSLQPLQQDNNQNKNV